MFVKLAKLKDMSFEEWEKYKRERERQIVGDAKRVDINHRLYDIFFSLDRLCYDGMFQFIPLYWIPEKMKQEHPGAVGLYNSNHIMVDLDYYESHGTDEAVINTVYHELTHCFCDWKHRKDTDGSFHTEAFKAACEETGGACDYVNALDGFSHAYLTPETMELVKERLKTYDSKLE